MSFISYLQDLGILTAITGIIAWTFKVVANNYIASKAKSYEHQLDLKTDEFKHKLSLEAEGYKNKLNVDLLKATKLHEKRILIVEELYQKIAQLNSSMMDLTAVFKLSQPDKTFEEADQERMTKSADLFNNFVQFYSKNKIYFKSETCELLEQLKAEYFDSWNTYTMTKRFNLKDAKFSIDNAVKASDKVRKTIPPVLEKLENDFRELVGVKTGDNNN